MASSAERLYTLPMTTEISTPAGRCFQRLAAAVGTLPIAPIAPNAL